MKKTLLLAGAACLMGFNAEASILAPYIGADYVNVNADYGNENKDKYADKFNSYGVSAGIKLTNNFAIEGFYQQSEDKDKNSNGGYAGADFNSSLKLKSYGIDLVSDVLNLGKVEILTSIGYTRYEAETKSRLVMGGATSYAHKNDEGDGIRFGIGGQINLTDNLGIRGMFRYAVTDLDSVKNYQEFAVGLRYKFW